MNRSKMNAVSQTAQSLFIIYNHLPEKVRKEFNNLLKTNQISGTEIASDIAWLKLSDETLSSIWETPENEIWDDYYFKQTKKRNV